MSDTHSWVRSSVPRWVAVIATLAVAPALAQGSGSVPPDSSKLPGSGPESAQGAEIEAQRLLDQALSELRLGQSAAAQRRLEAMIARYPDTTAATAARAKIVELYTAPVRETPRSSLGVPPPPAAAKGDWKVDVRLHPKLSDDLRMKAGDRVFFSSGSAELSARAREALRQQADWLKRRPALDVVVEGHCDEPGSPAELQALAQRRADAVRQRLIEEGVAPQRLRTLGRGNADKVALCGDAVCSAQNRRVVTRVEEPPSAEVDSSGVARSKQGLPR